MFCPKCGAEYRPGYTSCADCHVFLVNERPRAHQLARLRRPETDRDVGESGASAETSDDYSGSDRVHAEPGDPNEDPFCSFWKGTDARVCAELCTVLDEAGIPHKTIHRQDHLFNFANQSPYELGVPASLYEKAELAVKEAFGTDDENTAAEHRLLREQNDVVADLGTLSPWMKFAKGYAQSRNPNDEAELTIDDTDRGGFEAEQEVGLNAPYPEDPTVEVWSGEDLSVKEMIEMSLRENNVVNRDEQVAGQWTVFVLAEDEARAKEIVREIVEGAPLE